KALRRIRRRRVNWSAILVVAVALLVLKFSMLGLMVAAVAVVIVIAIDPYLFDYQYRRNLRNLYKEKLGVENEFSCDVELLPEGLKTTSLDCSSNTQWSMIEDIVTTGDSVDIFGRKGGGCIVRDRAFGSAEQKQQFVELARDYVNKARAAKPG
ncbi:MAG TPA: YcxB family protein, partial [Pyrinomonadaceae bacterium]|nr:YcxB family protein [Pyrinomonadaceae bacterium]